MLAVSSPIACADDLERLRVGGRVQLDAGLFSGDVTPSQDVELRRVRLQAGGNLTKRASYFAHYDLDLSDGELSPIDLWVRYRFSRRHTLTIANQITPIGLDAMTSSLDTWFTERALPTALAPGYRLSAQWRMRQEHWTLTTAVSGGRLRAVSELDDALQHSGGGLTARIGITPFDGKDNRVAHLGFSTDTRTSDDNGVRLRARPESNLAEQRLINTGRMRDADATWTSGLELALLFDRLSVQSELIQSVVQRADSPNPRFWGGYIASSWMLFGEPRRYSHSNRRFRRYAPEGPSLEFALRLSTLDLEAGDVTGGEQTNLSAAMHLYAARHWRWTVNYTTGRADPDRRGDARGFGILTLRAQYQF